MQKGFTAFSLGLALLALVVALGGCVDRWTPEQGAALTATAQSYLVPTPTPRPPATVAPTPQLQSSPTEASAPTTAPPPQPQSSPTEAGAPTAAPTPQPQSSLTETNAPTAVPSGTQPGDVAPDFTLPAASGEPVTLSSFRGQPVVLVFWASWCGHCQNEMPHIQSIYEQYHGQGLVVLGISVPGLGGETREKALAFVDQKGIAFPIVFDDQGQVYKEYNVAGVPDLIFVNREGVVVNNHAGEMAEAQLTAQVEQMMGAQ